MLIILCAGLASQWLAWRLRLPAIVILIASGLLLGPVSGIIELGLSQTALAELIGLGVAIILFEGGMDLKLGEIRRVGHGVGRLTILGPPLAWIFGTLAAHYIAGLSWPVAWVLGAILVVTGPTVILPMLHQARLNKESASLLKWEGIVNDPVGVLLAVLTFQYFTNAGSGWQQAVAGLGMAILAAAVFGGLGGWITGWLYRRGWVPSNLKPPALMVHVLAAYWVSNQVQHEAGLLSVTVMGLVMGNVNLVEREQLRQFKENLTVVLLAVLFIVIPSQLKMEQLELLDWRMAAFVLAVLLLVRPLAIFLSTLSAPMRGEDKLLLAWIAPRGIVAAATAGIFGPAMVAAGHPDAEALLPIVFLIIIVTVLVHGLTLGPLARKMSLAAKEENGLLIVGASPWAQALAQTLKNLNVHVTVADGSHRRLKPIHKNGVKVYSGEILSEHAEHELEDEHLSFLLCATDNHYYNALVCNAQGDKFGHHRTFQLAPYDESDQEKKKLTLQQRGYFAFKPPTDYYTLQQHLRDGWTLKSIRLSTDFDIERLKSRLGEPGKDWILIGSLSPQGALQIYSNEQGFKLTADWTLLYFSPGIEKDAQTEAPVES
jgi:CPA1 family monovalent cation:H+ antiporter